MNFSNRGKPLLLVEGNEYRFDKLNTSNTLKYWRCAVQGCRARAISDLNDGEGRVNPTHNQHTHDFKKNRNQRSYERLTVYPKAKPLIFPVKPEPEVDVCPGILPDIVSGHFSNKGKPLLILDDYEYRFDKFNTAKSLRYWRCAFPGCRARAVSDIYGSDARPNPAYGEHNGHGIQGDRIQARTLKNGAKLLAVLCPEQEAGEIARFVHNGASDAVKKVLPKPNSIIKTFYRHRNRIAFDNSEAGAAFYSALEARYPSNDSPINHFSSDDVQAFSKQLDAILADPITGQWIKFDSRLEETPIPTPETTSTLTIDDLLRSETIQ
uniref:FLYWCH-type domain-containing protein n=1 Tax=Panagrolaimus sp. JU765 TaxID=591449 RepID=A0AC34QDH0_9BILA